MVFYIRNDPVMCLTFPSCLKGASSKWFYSLPPCSVHNFSEVTEAFFTQYAIHQKAKRNSHHLLSVKMRPEMISNLTPTSSRELTKISKCVEKVSALAFISGLQITHHLYKNLLKHNLAKMSEALSDATIQL